MLGKKISGVTKLREFALGLVLIAAALVAPAAHAGALSTYMQNKLIDFVFRAQSYTPPATIYVALTTTTPTASSCGTEVTGGSYARVAITSSLGNWAGTQGAGTTAISSGSTGQTSNNGTVTFPAPTANWNTVLGFCLFDSVSSGNMLVYSTLTVPVTITSGGAAPSFAISALTYTLN